VITSRKPYKTSQIDFVAAYVIPLEIWYIIPVHAFCGRWYIHFSPHLKTTKYARYQEAWHLLRAKAAKSCRRHGRTVALNTVGSANRVLGRARLQPCRPGPQVCGL
jgi:hypothetical protein